MTIIFWAHNPIFYNTVFLVSVLGPTPNHMAHATHIGVLIHRCRQTKVVYLSALVDNKRTWWFVTKLHWALYILSCGICVIVVTLLMALLMNKSTSIVMKPNLLLVEWTTNNWKKWYILHTNIFVMKYGHEWFISRWKSLSKWQIMLGLYLVLVTLHNRFKPHWLSWLVRAKSACEKLVKVLLKVFMLWK